MKAKTEFGKGLVTCLIYFAQHIGRLNELWWIAADYEKNKILPEDWQKGLEIWKTFEHLLSSKITSWANGATDHLYEIKVPRTSAWREIRGKVKKLRDVGLEMGHGYVGRNYTLKDVDELIKLISEIAIEIDKIIGLNPDVGKWQ